MIARGFLLSTLFPLLLSAETVVVLRADDTRFGREYFSGFSAVATEKISAYAFTPENETATLRQAQRLAPDLLFTIGDVPARRLTEMFPTTPILLSDMAAPFSHPNIVVAETRLSVEAGIPFVKRLFPNRKKIGTIYDPKYSQAAYDRLSKEGGKIGATFLPLKVERPEDVATFLHAFEGKIELFYWLHDPTTSAEPAVKAVYAYMEKRSIPVFSLDPRQQGRGALLLLTVDPRRLGEHAWKGAAKILKEKKISPARIGVTSDSKVAAFALGLASRFGLTAEVTQQFLKDLAFEGYGVVVVP